MQGPFIENCFCLTPKRVDKSLNRPRKLGDNSDFERSYIQYTEEEMDGKDYLVVTVDGYEPQKITQEFIETSFGEKWYFKCGKCDSRCHKLYLLPKGHIFLCKKCHSIKYENFNPSSKQGQLFIRAKKILKLIDQQANMTSRIWYRSVYTKRYEKFLAGCLKAGLTDVVAEARALQAIINQTAEK